MGFTKKSVFEGEEGVHRKPTYKGGMAKRRELGQFVDLRGGGVGGWGGGGGGGVAWQIREG